MKQRKQGAAGAAVPQLRWRSQRSLHAALSELDEEITASLERAASCVFTLAHCPRYEQYSVCVVCRAGPDFRSGIMGGLCRKFHFKSKSAALIMHQLPAEQLLTKRTVGRFIHILSHSTLGSSMSYSKRLPCAAFLIFSGA